MSRVKIDQESERDVDGSLVEEDVDEEGQEAALMVEGEGIEELVVVVDHDDHE